MAKYDVVAVALDSNTDRSNNTVRIMATGKTLENAEAFVDMAVVRRGVETEFFAVAKAGKYKDGDVWRGL